MIITNFAKEFCQNFHETLNKYKSNIEKRQTRRQINYNVIAKMKMLNGKPLFCLCFCIEILDKI